MAGQTANGHIDVLILDILAAQETNGLLNECWVASNTESAEAIIPLVAAFRRKIKVKYFVVLI